MKKQNENIRVLVTGIGTLSGLGLGIGDTWKKIANDENAIIEKDEWTIEGLSKEYFGKCHEFEYASHFPDATGIPPLRYSQLALLGCKLAIEDAGLDLTGDNSRIGLIVNSDLGANTAAENYALCLYGRGPERVSPFEFTKSVANCVVGDVARQFKLTGPSSFIIGENSISYGIDLIRSGKADIMICGGFDEVRERTVWNYSRRNMTLPVDEESGDAANKMIFGEGSGFVVLESEAHALSRSARIYAEVMGEYSSCDSLCNEVIWERDASDLSYTMERALQTSEVGFEQIDFIMGSSCLPWQLQSYEMPAIKQIWKELPVNYTSIKSRTGETFSSSPPIAFSIAAAALYNKEIPSAGWQNHSWKLRENPVVLIDRIPDMPATYCLVNSIQIGGNTTAIVLKVYSEN